MYTQSTLAAEALAMRDALDEVIYLGSIITELCCNNCRVNELSVVAYTDNKSLHENLHSMKQVREKRLRTDMAEIRRMLNADDIQRIIRLPTKLQLANALTKRGTNTDMLLDFINSGQIKF